MPDTDISDLWWLKPGGGQDQSVGQQFLQGMNLGQKWNQDQIENTFKEEELRNQGIRIRAAAETALAKQVTDAQKAKGFAELSSHLAKVAETGGWGNPKNEGEFWSIVGRWSPMFDKDEVDKIYNNSYGKHAEFKLKEDEAKRKDAEAKFIPGEPIITADGTRLYEVTPGHWQQAHADETIETYTDEQGHQQVRFSRGGKAAKDPNAPTTGVTTKIQESLLGAEKAIELGANAANALTPESVGLKGQFNKVIINEGLAQLFPGMAKGDVTEAQTLLGNFNEKAVQALTASGDKRVSDKDMERFKRILPKMSAGESLENAKKKIQTFMGELRREARVDATKLNQPVPEWALTSDEVINMVAQGKMTLEKAKEVVRKYQIPE